MTPSPRHSTRSGVANERARTRAKATELREQLKKHFKSSNQPVWVGVQNRGEDDPDQYWIGRALRIEKEYTAAGRVGRVSYDKGDVIDGLDRADSDTVKVFHAGTAEKDGQVVTSGGRVLCVTGVGDTVGEAQANAYAGVKQITWRNAYHRTDIGYRAVAREKS